MNNPVLIQRKKINDYAFCSATCDRFSCFFRPGYGGAGGWTYFLTPYCFT